MPLLVLFRATSRRISQSQFFLSHPRPFFATLHSRRVYRDSQRPVRLSHRHRRCRRYRLAIVHSFVPKFYLLRLSAPATLPYRVCCPATPASWFLVSEITPSMSSVSYTHLRAHETPEHLVCRLLLEKK